MTDLAVAVWGLGPHALRNIVPALSATRGIRVAGLVSRDKAVLSEASRGYACPGWPDPSEMLQRTDIDAVFVATPIGLHHAHGRAVLEAGKHLWCEKPFVGTLAAAEDLVALSRARSAMVGEGLMYMFHPQFAALRHVVMSGELGAIVSLTSRFGIPALARPGFRNDPSLGGGAFLDVGCYPISLASSFVGDGELRVAFADVVTPAGSPVDAFGRASLVGSGGTTVQVEWRIGASYRNDVDVWCERGSVYADRIFSKPVDVAPELRLRDHNGRERSFPQPAGNHFVKMFECFHQWTRDDAAAERERRAIVRRAGLMERIRSAALAGSRT